MERNYSNRYDKDYQNSNYDQDDKSGSNRMGTNYGRSQMNQRRDELRTGYGSQNNFDENRNGSNSRTYNEGNQNGWQREDRNIYESRDQRDHDFGSREHFMNQNRYEGQRDFRGGGSPDYERSSQGYRPEGRDNSYPNSWGGPEQSYSTRGVGQGRIDSVRDSFEGDQKSGESSTWENIKGMFTGKGPKGYQRSDERIKEDVCDALQRHPHIDASDIEVDVKNCEVTLKGTVLNRDMKRKAEHCIEDLSGVREVHNQIRLHREDSSGVQNAARMATGSDLSSKNDSQNQNKTRNSQLS